MIFPEDVTQGFPTTVSEDEIQILIDMLSGADACLTANNVPEDTGNILKIYAARHFLQLQSNSGRGQVRSESAPSGASRSFASWSQGKGLDATQYGMMLKQLDKFGCIRGMIENDQSLVLMSVGPKRCKRGRF